MCVTIFCNLNYTLVFGVEISSLPISFSGAARGAPGHNKQTINKNKRTNKNKSVLHAMTTVVRYRMLYQRLEHSRDMSTMKPQNPVGVHKEP